MTTSIPTDVQRAMDARMATGNYASADDVLRDAFRALQYEDDEVVSIQEVIDDWQQGDEGLPLDASFDAIRRAIQEGNSP